MTEIEQAIANVLQSEAAKMSQHFEQVLYADGTEPQPVYGLESLTLPAQTPKRLMFSFPSPARGFYRTRLAGLFSAKAKAKRKNHD